MTPHEGARALFAEGRVEQAEAACAALLTAEARDAEALHLMGLIRFRQERLDEAAFLLGTSASLEDESSVWSDLACVHLAQGEQERAVAALERALAIDPGNAPGWCLLGYAYEALDDRPMAVRCFSRATQLDPRNADAHAHLAALRAQDGQTARAVESYRAALDADPARPAVWSNLGVLLRGEEALACFDEALRLDPGYADGHFNRAQALGALDRPDDAVLAYEAALALAPERADVAHNLAGALMEANRPLEAAERFAALDGDEARFSQALALLVAGDLPRGLELYEARLSIPSMAVGRHDGIPRWNGENPRGRTILVHAEQGLGDTIQFLRYVRLLANAGARVVAEVPATLLELARTLRGAAKVVMTGEALPRCHFQIPVMSLARAFGTTLETAPAACPYLWPPPARTESWAARLPKAGGRMRVGVAWSGSAAFRNDRRRSMRVQTLAPLLARPGCLFHVLQTEVRPDDRTWLSAHREVHDAGWQFVDVSDTAAVTAMMDVVISVDTSVAHLAGALAVPVFVLLPYAPDWRWLLGRDDSPWYPTARLFRQRAPGGWDDVVRRAGEALDDLG